MNVVRIVLMDKYYFKYLGSQVAADEECEMDVVHRIIEGYLRGEY